MKKLAVVGCASAIFLTGLWDLNKPGLAAEAPSVLVFEGRAVRPSIDAATGKALVLAREIANRNPQSSAPPAADASGRIVVQGVSEASVQGQMAELEPRLPIGTALMGKVVPRSQALLQQVQERFFEEPFFRIADRANMYSAHVDAERNQVIIEAGATTPRMLQDLAREYPNSEVSVNLLPGTTGGSPSAGRQADNSPFYGGAVIGCTTGFSWVSAIGNLYMITAGHCFPSGGTASTPVATIGNVGSGNFENWTAGTGSVPLSGTSSFSGDLAMIRVQAGLSNANRIYSGAYNSTTSIPITGVHTAYTIDVLDEFCSGGAQSGEQCGWDVDWEDGSWYYNGTGETAKPVTAGNKGGHCVRPGDSGGPAYTKLNGVNKALGVISGVGGYGGSDYYAGTFDPNCRIVITQMYTAQSAFTGGPRTS